MVLLRRILELREDRVVCEGIVEPSCPFVESGAVRAVVAIEWMAQAAAVLLGIRGFVRGEPTRRGFLLGTRRLQLDTDRFAVGTRFTVEAFHEWGDDNMALFRCEVAERDGVKVSGRISVALAPDEREAGNKR
jgi:predicted hotdog family 3-hydroxylacyl-ACP dehydratase